MTYSLKSVLAKSRELTARFEDILLRGSNWVFLSVKFCDLTITGLQPPKAYSNPSHAKISYS